VATNHDVLYAYCPDGGAAWRRSTGEVYALPITVASAEVAVPIPQGSGLIKQTTMAVDTAGRPWIATYWRPEGLAAPQYHLVWNDGQRQGETPEAIPQQPVRPGRGLTCLPGPAYLDLVAPYDPAMYLRHRSCHDPGRRRDREG